jgi:phenylalanyl-tRNA synthetase beta chain
MLVSLHWLKEFVDLPENLTPKEIGQALTMATVEVEGIKSQAELFSQIVVGRIVELKNHPNADSLKIAMTDIGQSKIVQIVCGGVNLFVGMLVAVALPGAKVRWHGQGELVKLTEAEIRGQKSFGMICASAEIGLGHLFPATEKEILNLSSTEAKPGVALEDVLGFNDVVIDIDNKSLTNRPDLWGHIGIARELAAIYNQTYKELEIGKIEKKSDLKIKIKIKSTGDCSRYLGVVVEGIEIGPSPIWLKKRLQAVGQKSINNIVDLTNYVMFETGQPLHAFDLKNLAGQQIVVRKATANEKIVTLDESELKLDEDTLVIADAKKPVALAGVIGGQYSGINQNTTTVVFESACFNSVNIRKAERKYGLRTDSAVRFEKGIEPERAELAMQRILFLLKKIQPKARVGEIVDVYKQKNKPLEIKFDLDFIQKRLGFSIPVEDIENILVRLGFTVKTKSKKFIIIPPVYRRLADVTIPEDIIEEVARIYGYDKFKPDLPTVQLARPNLSAYRAVEKKIKHLLSGSNGFYEVLNYSFTNQKVSELGYDLEKFVGLANSLSSEYTHLRGSLLPGLLGNIADNERWSAGFKLYEIGRIFRLDKKSSFSRGGKTAGYLPWQNYWLTGVITGKKDEVFFTAKGSLELLLAKLGLTEYELVVAPEKKIFSQEKLQVNVQGKTIGFVFRVNQEILNKYDIKQSVGVFELDLEELLPSVKKVVSYQSLPKYPTVIFDLAVVFPLSVAWDKIVKIVRASSRLVREVNLFDIYTGEQIGLDKKSVAFTLEFLHPERTLTSSEVDKEVEKILTDLKNKLHGVLRS